MLITIGSERVKNVQVVHVAGEQVYPAKRRDRRLAKSRNPPGGAYTSVTILGPVFRYLPVRSSPRASLLTEEELHGIPK